jgi:peptidoglycan/xylan/chitin deacetylase (PgdA/CDA1 family)
MNILAKNQGEGPSQEKPKSLKLEWSCCAKGKRKMSKRMALAKAMEFTGLTWILARLPSRPGVLLINHHSIGDAASGCFDRAIITASEDELDHQLAYTRKHFNVVGGDELLSLLLGRTPIKHFHVAFTFDDGYLDNYTSAFPILQSHGCSAIFFLVPAFVGTNFIPWWDEIAHRVRNLGETKIPAEFATLQGLRLETDREAEIAALIGRYKSLPPHRQALLIQELRALSGFEIPIQPRRFLNWDEARTMAAAGMTIGSHTATHPILSTLDPESQRNELAECKRELEANLHSVINTLAYPYGGAGDFNRTTEEIALSVGYQAAFAFFGGVNRPGQIRQTAVYRIEAERQPRLFRCETVLRSTLGRSLFS